MNTRPVILNGNGGCEGGVCEAAGATHLGGVRRQDGVHGEGAPGHRVPIVAHLHPVRTLLGGHVLDRVHLIGRVRLQLAGDWPAGGRGDLDLQVTLTSGSLRADGKLLVLPDVHL